MTRLSLSLLGPLLIDVASDPGKRFESNRVRALLIYLAVESNYPHRREELAALLWPDQPEYIARTNLRQALSNLRRTLDERNAREPLVYVSPEAVQFARAGDYRLDVADFIALLEACKTHSHRRLEACRACLQRFEQAISLYRGDFLAAFTLGDSAAFDEWAALKRERLHHQACATLAHLMEVYERLGHFNDVTRIAQRLLELDPWREEAHRALMRMLVHAGQRNAALAQFDACRRVLVAALGVEPDDETVALFEQIRDTLSDAKRAPTNMAAEDSRISLPPQPTPFVGREDERSELGDLLNSPDCRLVTIAGPGGIGKTRLALAVAAEQGETFTDGVVFVSLAALDSADFLVSTLCTALHIQVQGDGDPKEHLVTSIGGREMLLLLDNFEHVLAGAGIVAELLERCPRVLVLVTSRERLQLQWEWVYDIEGLAYPPHEVLDEAHSYSAFQLFTQRVRQVRRHGALVGDEAHAAVRICRLVEGMPLAIELAAALVREYSCQEIAARVAVGMGDLAGEFRDKPARHRSMRAVFDHSWRLLNPAEQVALRQLAIFRGGFSVDAANVVAGTTQALLSTLVEKSLARKSLDARTARRYELHEAVRQYAFEKLAEAGEAAALQQRHVAFFLTLVEAAEPGLSGAEQATWFQHLECEHDNLRAALAASFAHNDIETAARMSGALRHFWEARGLLPEGRRWLEQALASSRSLSHPVRAKALHGAGALAFYQGDTVAARRYFEEGEALCRLLNDNQGIAGMLNGQGNVAHHLGDYQTARTLFEESLSLMRAMGDKGGSALALNNLGTAAWAQGDYLSARVLFEASLALQREMGDEWSVAYALNNLGSVAITLGEYENAARLLAESLIILDAFGDKRAIASTLEEFAILSSIQNQGERALRLASTADALRKTINAPRDVDGNLTLEEHLARARASIDAVSIERAWSSGQAMKLAQAIAYALEAMPSKRA